ncbi:hypothetical protein TELCIR_16814, partial [Teladorsagia circumcincta]
YVEYSATKDCEILEYGPKKVKDFLSSLNKKEEYLIKYDLDQNYADDEDLVERYRPLPNSESLERFLAVCYTPTRGTRRHICRKIIEKEDGSYDYTKISKKDFDDFYKDCVH